MINKYLNQLTNARKEWNSDLFEKIMLIERSKDFTKEKREYQRLNSELAQLVKSRGRVFYEVYRDMVDNPEDFDKLYELGQFQIDQFVVSINDLLKIKDTEDYGRNLSRLAGHIKNNLLTILGLKEIRVNMGRAEKLVEAQRRGLKYWGR